MKRNAAAANSARSGARLPPMWAMMGLMWALAGLIPAGCGGPLAAQTPGGEPPGDPASSEAAQVGAWGQEGMEEYGLFPGDQVEIMFFSQAGEPLPQIAGQRVVDHRGRIFLPLVGAVEVEGLDTDQLRERLEERYTDFFETPTIDVVVGLRVNITGAVRQPGHYFVPPGATLVDALSLAGGTLSELDMGQAGGAADPGRVQLNRRDGTYSLLDLRPDRAAGQAANLPVRSGDWLHVPRQARSVWRQNIQLVSSVVGLVGSVAALIILLND